MPPGPRLMFTPSGFLLVLIELIAQHGDHHDQRADGEIEDIAA